MTMKNFDDFVQDQVTQAEELRLRNAIDWPQRLEAWQDELSKLYSDMEEHLKKYITAGKIKIQREFITISEPKFESYKAEKLTFSIGLGKVIAKPVGMDLIGAKGRVDLTGQMGSRKIVLFDKGAPAWVHTTTLPDYSDDTQSEVISFKSKIDEYGWYIITSPPPRMTAIPFGKESFQQAVMELSNV